MRFLVDESVSPLVAQQLVAAGHDAQHVHELGLSGSTDRSILDEARRAQRVLITMDTDFGALLASSPAVAPSIVLFRGDVTRRPHSQAELLIANLEPIADDLEAGSVVVIGDDRIRVRRLPI